MHAYNAQLELMQQQINASENRGRRNTRGVRPDYGELARNGRSTIIDPNPNVQEAATSLQDKLQLIDDEIKQKEKELRDLDSELGPQSPADFENYAKSIAASAIRKFRAVYNDDDALKKSREALMATKVFNPLYLATNPQKFVRDSMIDALENYDVSEFKDNNFLSDLKDEIDEAVQLAQQPYEWDTIEDSKLYVERLRDRKRRQRKMAIVAEVARRENQVAEQREEDILYHGEWNADEVHEIPNDIMQDGNEMDDVINSNDWRKDPGEVARRILIWWRESLQSGRFKNIALALSIILLAQPHSAAAERAFSQLSYVWRITGRQALQDQAYIRTMMRVNNQYDKFE